MSMMDVSVRGGSCGGMTDAGTIATPSRGTDGLRLGGGVTVRLMTALGLGAGVGVMGSSLRDASGGATRTGFFAGDPFVYVDFGLTARPMRLAVGALGLGAAALGLGVAGLGLDFFGVSTPWTSNAPGFFIHSLESLRLRLDFDFGSTTRAAAKRRSAFRARLLCALNMRRYSSRCKTFAPFRPGFRPLVVPKMACSSRTDGFEILISRWMDFGARLNFLDISTFYHACQGCVIPAFEGIKQTQTRLRACTPRRRTPQGRKRFREGMSGSSRTPNS